MKLIKNEFSNNINLAVHEHQLATSHNADFDKVKISDRADSDFKPKFKEILQTYKINPLLIKIAILLFFI